MEPVEEDTRKSLLHPFSQLVQESEDHLDIIPSSSVSLPDANALMNVTSRRKNHPSKVGLSLHGDYSTEKLSEFADFIFESAKPLKDLSNSSKEARLTNEQLLLLSTNLNFTEGFNGGDTNYKLSASIEEIAFQFDLLKNACEAAFAVNEECFQFFGILSEIFEDFKMLPKWCIVQMKSIVIGHKSINGEMNKKLKEVEFDKEKCLHHDMEKDELLYQVLYLQKEVSQLSSSLVWEKDALKKELDKTKSKLKDTDYKLKNVTQENVKLEDDYNKLELLSFEMEAENSSLKEALEITIGEKEYAFVKNDNLNSELEDMANKLKAAFSDMELLKKDLERMEQRLAESESSSRELEYSLDLLSKEKEDMISQLTEAHLEVEAEKLGWNSKEKTLIEKLERSNNENFELSKNLSEVIKELNFYKDQCKSFGENLCLSDRVIKSEKYSSMSKSSEIDLQRDEFDRLKAKADGNKTETTKFELVSCQLCPPCSQIHNPRSSPLRVTGGSEKLLSKVDKLRSLEFEMETLEEKYNDLLLNAELFFQELNHRISSFEVEMHAAAHHGNKEMSKLKEQLSSKQAKLDTYRRRLKESMDERKFMDSKYQEASTNLKDQLRLYGHHILDLTKQLAEKK